ncbi:hypothetical protein C0J52_10663 [Blattella germanica]|nr:hypothetical protein C0J52_10663 [Blattella germanica]
MRLVVVLLWMALLRSRCFSAAGCSEGGGLNLMADLLFTCCVPMTSHAAAVVPVRSNVLPIRREDIDHRNNEIVGASHSECGMPRITIQKRIIGGNEAYFGEFPWQAHIRIAGYQCGGVLVSR